MFEYLSLLEVAFSAAKYTKRLCSFISKSKYLNYDIDFLMQTYVVEENNIERRIPYSEILNFDSNTKNILFRVMDGDFVLGNNNDNNIKLLQTEALKEFAANKKFTFDSTVVRLENVIEYDDRVELVIRRAKYSDQVQGQLCLDWLPSCLVKDDFSTLRSILRIEYHGFLPPLNTTLLANSIGLSIIVYYENNGRLEPFLPLRNKSLFFNKAADEVALNEGMRTTTASGAMEMSSASITMGYIQEEILRELKEEIGIDINDMVEVKPLVLVREYLRAGKPQIFFYGRTALTRMQIIEKMRLAVNKAKISSQKVEVKLKDDISNSHTFSIEALANLYYCENYLKKLSINNQ